MGKNVLAVVLALGATAKAQAWQQYADIEQAGWSATELEGARELAARIGTAAVFIVDRGHVVAAWGHPKHPFKSASIRKSLYDATMGAVHYRKPFDVRTTLAKMEIDDLHPLSEDEKQATFEDLVSARSGVYHPAAYETASNARRRPERGSARPGSSWYYNNWDFNVTCVAFHRLTGSDIASAFAERLVRPLGLEDFEPRNVFAYLEPRQSRHPALTMRISARDLARIGRLYLQKGMWDGKRLVAADWIARSTEPLTTFAEGHYRGAGNGYGRMWWVFPSRQKRDAPYESHHRIAARGSGGQIMVLFPKLQLVIVHMADTDRGRGVSTREGVRLLNKIVGARRAGPNADCELGPVRIEKLANEPQPRRVDMQPVTKAHRDAFCGTYMFSKRAGLRLYEHEARLFCQPLGLPVSNDVELFEADGVLRSPTVSVVLEPVGKAGGPVTTMRMTWRGRTMTGERKP